MRQASWEEAFTLPFVHTQIVDTQTTERERERVLRNLHYADIVRKLKSANGKFNYFQPKFPWESRVFEMQIPSFGFESDEDVTTGFFFIACDFEFYSSLDYHYYFMLIRQGRGWCLHTRFIFNFVSIWINSWYLWKTLRYMPVINKPVKQFKQWLRSSYLIL